MSDLSSTIPDAETMLSLEPEELAEVLLRYLSDDPGKINRYNIGLPNVVQGYPREFHDKLLEAVMEAWVWLEKEMFVAPKPGSGGHWYFITRRGQQILDTGDLTVYLRATVLPKHLLLPVLLQRVWPTFLRGAYDLAVFQAFKEVEVAVRLAAGYSTDQYGVPMMREAFNVERGPLTDYESHKSERDALLALFAGALGLFKNPPSHRHVDLPIEEAVEQIMLANHLLRLVYSRTE